MEMAIAASIIYGYGPQACRHRFLLKRRRRLRLSSQARSSSVSMLQHHQHRKRDAGRGTTDHRPG